PFLARFPLRHRSARFAVRKLLKIARRQPAILAADRAVEAIDRGLELKRPVPGAAECCPSTAVALPGRLDEDLLQRLELGELRADILPAAGFACRLKIFHAVDHRLDRSELQVPVGIPHPALDEPEFRIAIAL